MSVFFTLIDISSNNSIKPNYVGENDIVSLNMTASEDINQPIVVFQCGGDNINNTTITYSGSGNSWNAKYTVNVNDTNGSITFTIDATDNAGNAVTQAITTTNSSSVDKLGTGITTQEVNTVLGNNLDPGTWYRDNEGGSLSEQVQDDGYKVVAINKDGTVIAFPYDDNAYVFTYSGSGTTWTQSAALTTEDAKTACALNKDGDVVAFQVYDYISNNPWTYVYWRVYQNDGNGNWTQKGNDYEYSGTSSSDVANYRTGEYCMDLSDDGNILCIDNRENNDNLGYCHIYQYNSSNNNWEEMSGSPVTGSSSNEKNGAPCALSGDGQFLITGAWQQGSNTGVARFYGYINDTWTYIMGQHLNKYNNSGNTAPKAGRAVDFSSDGNYAVMGGGATNNVRVYEKSGDGSTSSNWINIQDIYISPGSYCQCVSISEDGKVIAAGDGDGKLTVYYSSNPGSVDYSSLGQLTDSDMTSMNQYGNNIGYNMDMSHDGTTIIFTLNSTYNQVFVVETGAPKQVEVTITKIAPDITSLTIESDNSISSTVGATGDEITIAYDFDLSVNTPMIDISCGSAAIINTITTTAVDSTYTSWTSTFTVDESDNHGIITFAIDASSLTYLGENTITQSDITSGNLVSIDKIGPNISDLSVNALNTEITINFGENVYNTNSSSGDIEKTDFLLSLSEGKYNPTHPASNATNPVAESLTKISQSVWKMSVSFTGTVGHQILTINPVTDSIFDEHGNAATSFSSNNILLNNLAVNNLNNIYLDGFLDISGGELRTRNTDDHLLIGGDASMSGNVFVKGNETIENKNIILSSTLTDISFTQLENTNFTQYAYDISGVESGGLAGHSISTSASGDIIAVGAPLNSGGGTARGEVRVYQKDNNSWLQLGNDLNGTKDNEEFGHSLDLNGDGTILAVGTKDLSHNTLVYKYDSGSWGLYGNIIYNNVSSENTFTIEGETIPSYGTTVSTETGPAIWANLTTSTDETKIISSNWTEYDLFSYDAVAIDGNYAIIGAAYQDTTLSNSGAAYIYELDTNGTWTEVAFLKTSDITKNDYFGTAVAISGNYAIVGAKGEDTTASGSGAAYIFERDTTTGIWGNAVSGQSYYTENQMLKASDPGASDYFGRGVSIHGTYAIIGSYLVDASTTITNSGAAYIFERDTNGIWGTAVSGQSYNNENQKLALNNPDEDRFGTSVSINGNYAIVGAPVIDDTTFTDSGAAYIFERDTNGIWGTAVSGQTYNSATVILKASNMTDSLKFGDTVAINGNYAMAGSGYESTTYSRSGAVWVFERDENGNWGTAVSGQSYNNENQMLKASNSAQNLYFGGLGNFQAVSISGNYAIVGAFGDMTGSSTTQSTGSAYIFERNSNGVWEEIKYIQASDVGSGDRFGTAVAISGSSAIVASHFVGTTDESGYVHYNHGAAYIYKAPTSLITTFRVNTLSASTKPKLNKTGDKLTIFNEKHFQDLSSNGFVQSYQYSESDASWNYLGDKIESASINDISGGDIAINDEGNMVAIGYPQTNSATGTTKVFKYDTSWNQVGSNIEGSATGDHAGTSVVIDGSGDLVAIGSPFAGDASAGEINVYQNVSDTWTLYGNKIQGQADNDQFGTSIDIDSSGTILAVGAVNANAGAGNVNIYQYNETDSSWNKVGGDLTGDAVGDLTGTSVKLNQLGTEVSVGEPGSNSTFYYTPWTYASQTQLDWNFLFDGSTSVTSSISGHVGTYVVGSNVTAANETYHGKSTASGGFASTKSSSNNLEDGAGITGIDIPHGNATKFTYEFYFDFGTKTYADNDGCILITTTETATTLNGWVEISINGENFECKYYDDGDNSGSYYSFTAPNPAGSTGTGKQHIVIATHFMGTAAAFEAHVNGVAGAQGNNWGSGKGPGTHDTRWLNLLGCHDRTLPNTGNGWQANLLFFRLHKFDWNDQWYQELYNIREPIPERYGGSRTFEIEHTKIYEHEYNTQSNSVIVGHNEYSRNQFATALDVSGNVDVSGNITVTGNVTIPGDITVDALNYNSINKSPPISIDYSDITEDLSFNHKIEIMTNDNSLQTSSLTIHNDLSNNGTFGSSFVYDNSLSVTGSVLVVDASNTNYGSYTVYSKGDGSDSFMVGKSASHVFNIVNQSNVGVWMQLDGNSFHSTSDERLKKDIEDLGEETDSIMKLRPVKFHWNYEEEDKEKHIGFIAQEVEELFPDLVEENTYPDGSTYKGVDKTKLIPHLVNEIKSIKKEIEELKK
jgi:hypothetical protein